MLAVGSLIATYEQASAQSSVLVVSTDTLNNTETANIALPRLTGGYYAIGIQALVTRVSGTAAGSAFVQGSLDGTNWVSVSDTLTFTNVASQTKIWAIATPVYEYYRVQFSSNGTVVAVPKVRYRALRLLTN